MPPVIDDLLCCASSTSVSLIIFSAFFIREFLTHIFHHVTPIRCKIWRCRLNSLSNGMVNFLLCDLNRASFSVSHHLVNATAVQLCEMVHHGRQLSVHVRVSLLTCAELCSRLQLCSTARSLHSDPSLAGSLASSSRLLLRYLDSILLQLVGRHALGRLLQHLVVCCLLWSSPLRYHVCRKTCLLSCLRDASQRVTSPFGALFGPPTAFRRNGPSVPWVSLP